MRQFLLVGITLFLRSLVQSCAINGGSGEDAKEFQKKWIRWIFWPTTRKRKAQPDVSNSAEDKNFVEGNGSGPGYWEDVEEEEEQRGQT